MKKSPKWLQFDLPPETNLNTCIVFDMDGVLAQYNKEDYQEPYNYLKPNYFSKRPVDSLAVQLIDKLIQNHGANRVFVISSIPANISTEQQERIYQEKREWLRKHIPSFDSYNFLPIYLHKQKNKAKIFEKVAIDCCSNTPPNQIILIDDFNPNLKDWENNGWTGVKYVNGINDPNSFDGIKIHHDNTPSSILAEFYYQIYAHILPTSVTKRIKKRIEDLRQYQKGV